MRGEWRAYIARPGARCMACTGQYDPGLVDAERQGLFEDPGYIQRLPTDQPLRANQNVFVSALAAASLELLHLVLLAIGPGGVRDVGGYEFHFPASQLTLPHAGCIDGCPYPGLVARGETAGAAG